MTVKLFEGNISILAGRADFFSVNLASIISWEIVQLRQDFYALVLIDLVTLVKKSKYYISHFLDVMCFNAGKKGKKEACC